jgi:hypothetical protein
MGLVMKISGSDLRKWYAYSGDFRDSKWFAIGFLTFAGPVGVGIGLATNSSESVTVRWTGGSIAVVAVVLVVFFFLRSARRKRKHGR